MPTAFSFILLAGIFGAIGQVFLKLTAQKATLNFGAELVKSTLNLLAQPSAYLAVLAYVICTLFYLKALKSEDLGPTYIIFFGITAIFALLFGLYFFHENFAPIKIIGILLVIAGIIITMSR